jgi:hypothetical protein
VLKLITIHDEVEVDISGADVAAGG